MIQTEHTPNPDTLKFLPGKKVSSIGPVEFFKNDKNVKIPLANKILSLEGTTMVFFGEDFITVKKESKLNWDDLKHHIISEINDHYLKGNKAVIENNFKKEDSDLEKEESSDVISKIKEVLDAKVRPAVARDGGDITFKSFKDGKSLIASLHVIKISSLRIFLGNINFVLSWFYEFIE